AWCRGLSSPASFSVEQIRPAAVCNRLRCPGTAPGFAFRSPFAAPRAGNRPMPRSSIVQRLACAAILLCLLGGADAATFGFDSVALRARRLSEAPYKERESNVPAHLQALDYERYREIRFRQEKALWRQAGLSFQIAFFHEGRYYDRPVKINEVSEE